MAGCEKRAVCGIRQYPVNHGSRHRDAIFCQGGNGALRLENRQPFRGQHKDKSGLHRVGQLAAGAVEQSLTGDQCIGHFLAA